MARNQQANRRGGRRRGSPGPLSRWVQQRMNARMNRNIRRGRLHPDWCLNLMAHPERSAQAWQRITAAQPRYAKYQRKTDREYPVARLTLR
jgi:hypothetical protein